jgi:pyruvate kinase
MVANQMEAILTLPEHKTKLVCTIGPASESIEIMEKMLMAGMNVARLNFSHGAFDGHMTVIKNLRAAALKTGKQLAIMADLPGPKMRIGKIACEPVQLLPGASFTLTTDDIVGDVNCASVTFEPLPQVVRPGDTLYLNDGVIQMKASRVEGNEVECTIVVGGELRSRKGLNIPGIDLGISAFTEHDRNCLRFAIENGVDAVSQSFVESADDIEAVRKASAELGRVPFIIAKIERTRALDRLEEIIDAADGVMIARGDLGVEVPIEMIATVQKDIMSLANMKGKPVITATQMLESMIGNSRPTRAESTDVANAILDGTDCVMLSGESAMGSYPVEAVEMLGKIAVNVEPNRRPISAQKMRRGVELGKRVRPANLITIAVEECLKYVIPAAVFVPTHSGATARSLSRYRLPVWTVAISSQKSTCQGLQFSYGVFPMHETDHPGNWKSYITQWLASHKMKGDFAILTEGPSSKFPENNNKMEIIDLRGKS